MQTCNLRNVEAIEQSGTSGDRLEKLQDLLASGLTLRDQYVAGMGKNMTWEIRNSQICAMFGISPFEGHTLLLELLNLHVDIQGSVISPKNGKPILYPIWVVKTSMKEVILTHADLFKNHTNGELEDGVVMLYAVSVGVKEDRTLERALWQQSLVDLKHQVVNKLPTMGWDDIIKGAMQRIIDTPSIPRTPSVPMAKIQTAAKVEKQNVPPKKAAPPKLEKKKNISPNRPYNMFTRKQEFLGESLTPPKNKRMMPENEENVTSVRKKLKRSSELAESLVDVSEKVASEIETHLEKSAKRNSEERSEIDECDLFADPITPIPPSEDASLGHTIPTVTPLYESPVVPSKITTATTISVKSRKRGRYDDFQKVIDQTITSQVAPISQKIVTPPKIAGIKENSKSKTKGKDKEPQQKSLASFFTKKK